MLKSFEYKVNKFLRDYGKDLDDDYEEMWKEKIVITKKAVEKYRRESEAMKEAEEREKLKERAETSARKEAEEKERLEERAESSAGKEAEEKEQALNLCISAIDLNKIAQI